MDVFGAAVTALWVAAIADFLAPACNGVLISLMHGYGW